MKKLISILLIAVLVFGLVSCGGNGATSDSRLGKYLAYSAEMFGINMTAEELFGSPEGFVVELKSGGKVTIHAEGEKQNATYTLEGEKLTITAKMGSEELIMEGRLVDNMLYIDDMLGAGLNIAFYKEGTKPVEADVAPIEDPTDDADADDDLEVIEDSKDDEEVDSAERPVFADEEVLGNYYGIAYHKNSNENFFFDEELPIWAYLGPDSDGDIYFEIYGEEDQNVDSVLISMWVMMFDKTMIPFIGEENAWIYDVYLTDADTSGLTVEIEDNTLVMHYNYREVDEGTPYETDITFYLLKEGTPWRDPDF